MFAFPCKLNSPDIDSARRSNTNRRGPVDVYLCFAIMCRAVCLCFVIMCRSVTVTVVTVTVAAGASDKAEEKRFEIMGIQLDIVRSFIDSSHVLLRETLQMCHVVHIDFLDNRLKRELPSRRSGVLILISPRPCATKSKRRWWCGPD